MKNNERKVVERMARNDRGALDSLYKTYREPFLNYFRRYAISDEEIKDLYQDTMVALYQKALQGKLASVSSSIKTYVFGIGKHKVIDAIRKKGKEVDIPTGGEEYEDIDLEKPLLTKEQKKLYKYFTQLGESCQQMLKMFYYRGLDIQDIVTAGGYKDGNSVKSHKSRCLKQLRKLVSK